MTEYEYRVMWHRTSDDERGSFPISSEEAAIQAASRMNVHHLFNAEAQVREVGEWETLNLTSAMTADSI